MTPIPVETPPESFSEPRGLSPEEAKSRLLQFGFNELPRASRHGLAAILLGVLREPMFALLLAAGGLYLLLGDLQQGLLLLACALLSLGLVVHQESRSERVLETLRAGAAHSGPRGRTGRPRADQ